MPENGYREIKIIKNQGKHFQNCVLMFTSSSNFLLAEARIQNRKTFSFVVFTIFLTFLRLYCLYCLGANFFPYRPYVLRGSSSGETKADDDGFNSSSSEHYYREATFTQERNKRAELATQQF